MSVPLVACSVVGYKYSYIAPRNKSFVLRPCIVSIAEMAPSISLGIQNKTQAAVNRELNLRYAGPQNKKLRSKIRVQLEKWRKHITPASNYTAVKIEKPIVSTTAMTAAPPPPVAPTTSVAALAPVAPMTISTKPNCPPAYKLFVNVFNPNTQRISWLETSRIRVAMMDKCVGAGPNDFCPRFRHSRRVDGILFHVVCADAASKHWLVHLVCSLGFVWNDAPLPQKPRPFDQLMHTWSADFFVQNRPVKLAVMMRLLRRQNGKELRIDRWEVVRFETYRRDEDGHCGHFVVFGMPTACQRALMVQQECFLYYGLCKVRLERFQLPFDF